MSWPSVTWTPDMDAALIAARAEGLGHLACSERIGVCVHLVADRLRVLGLPLRLGNRGRIPREKAA